MSVIYVQSVLQPCPRMSANACESTEQPLPLVSEEVVPDHQVSGWTDLLQCVSKLPNTIPLQRSSDPNLASKELFSCRHTDDKNGNTICKLKIMSENWKMCVIVHDNGVKLSPIPTVMEIMSKHCRSHFCDTVYMCPNHLCSLHALKACHDSRFIKPAYSNKYTFEYQPAQLYWLCRPAQAAVLLRVGPNRARGPEYTCSWNTTIRLFFHVNYTRKERIVGKRAGFSMSHLAQRYMLTCAWI